MKTATIILPNGKGNYRELLNKYESYTYKFENEQLKISFLTEKDMYDLSTNIRNLLSEEDINVEDKLWLIKQYLNDIRLEKFDD
ncbi:hypothetical protein GCM10007424_01380 [Flavobacterium suaedae]|uniref:Uncharacterized protein n=1 Tax=Flavobacterium suaedae TaxID=1767027 RepID=A0ABQ1JCN6_9FLAO|nr:hypothetical protein [Flavobacterium suaedae]GGB65192.1 hypothetical protein GCM10007424_01380 [Flavobacterium suaedae]